MNVGEVIELSVDRLEKGGRAVGDHQGRSVVVSGLLPGEVAQVHIDHIGAHRNAYAHVTEVVKPSVHRRTAPCRHQPRCGGCPLMIAQEPFVANTKQNMLAELGVPVDRVVGGDHLMGYRWSSKRVAAHEGARLVLGSYAPGSHDVAPMGGCLVDHPRIAAALDELEDEASRGGGGEDLRYVWAKTNGAGQVLLTLVLKRDTDVSALASRLTIPAGVASCVQEASGNAMRGHSVRQLTGVDALTVELCGVPVRVGPLGFLQPNPEVAAMAYPDLVGNERGALAFDLYAGAGITTHLLRQQYAEVRACESSPESATALGITPERVEAFLARQDDRPDLIVANPPRAGLGREVCEALIAIAARGDTVMPLHVMSCEPRALARDLQQLVSSGHFERVGARAYDTLPQTAHIEVIAWLVTKK